MTEPRKFNAVPAVRGEEPLLIGLSGPPGGGKTFSALRLAVGMQIVRGGDVILIDTEGGRARKYADTFKFLHVQFDPPHGSDDFIAAIRQQIQRKPACIIIDSISDEHEGQGGYLEQHDEMIPKMGGNEWAAWARPKAARKRMLTGLVQIKVPLIFTFRARERTQQKRNDKGRMEVTNIGWMPVAPLEIVHSVDLMCVLPPRADGVPVWESTKLGEEFVIKLPNFLKPCIAQGALSEETGRMLALWARGDKSALSQESLPATASGAAPGVTSPPPGAAELSSDDVMRFDQELADASEQGMRALGDAWSHLPASAQHPLKAALDRRHKPRAQAVDLKAQAETTS